MWLFLVAVSLSTPLPFHHVMAEHKDYQMLQEFLSFSRKRDNLDSCEIKRTFLLYK